MAARIWGGIAGWLAAVVPLLAVNALDYFGIYYFPDPVIAGLVALVAGLLLGGIVAALAGRGRTGTSGVAISAAIAAILYSASLIGLLYASRATDAPPSLLTQHPVRVSAAILFFAALLLLVALVTGALTAQRTPQSEPVAPYPQRSAVPASGPNRRSPTPYPSAPGRSPYGPPSGAPGRLPSSPGLRDGNGNTRPRVYAPPQPSQPLRGPEAVSAPRNDRTAWSDRNTRHWQ